MHLSLTYILQKAETIKREMRQLTSQFVKNVSSYTQ